MKLSQIRVGGTQVPSYYADMLDGRVWPEKEHASGYMKSEVDSVEVSLDDGLVGNGIGFPTHIENKTYRAALVVNELVYGDFESALPGSSVHLQPGCFGENFVVDHPDLHPNVVCIGDRFRIGDTVEFQVTGPRMPCPKVDAFNGTSGVTALGRKTGWTGCFFRVIEPGICRKGDEITLLECSFPGFTIARVAKGLWGGSDEMDNTLEFLQTLVNMDCLIPRNYRDTAKQRLKRLHASSF